MRALDRIGWGSIYLGAVAEAFDGALKLNPHLAKQMPDFFDGALWAFLPFLLLTVGGAIVVVRRAWPSAADFLSTAKANKTAAQVRVINKKFANEKVLLDGHAYVSCKFTNVTFEYNGGSAVNLSDNDIYGSIRITSNSPVVGGTVAVLKGLGCLRPDIPTDFGPDSVVNAPQAGPRPAPK